MNLLRSTVCLASIALLPLTTGAQAHSQAYFSLTAGSGAQVGGGFTKEQSPVVEVAGGYSWKARHGLRWTLGGIAGQTLSGGEDASCGIPGANGHFSRDGCVPRMPDLMYGGLTVGLMTHLFDRLSVSASGGPTYVRVECGCVEVGSHYIAGALRGDVAVRLTGHFALVTAVRELYLPRVAYSTMKLHTASFGIGVR